MGFVSASLEFEAIQDECRPFLLPRVNALRLNMLALLSSVGNLGLSLPDRGVLDWELDEDEEDDRLRPSSARTSSKETFRWGWE